MVSSPASTPPIDPTGSGVAWSRRIDAVRRLATRARPADGSLRVIVGRGVEAAEPYLQARATVVGPDGREPDPRLHVHRPLDDSGLPGPRGDESAELVLVPEARVEQLDTLCRAARRALAPGGALVVGLTAGSSTAARARLTAAGLVVGETEVVDERIEVLVARDPRPIVELPAGLTDIDRSTCIDRRRVLTLASRPPWLGPDASRAAGTTEGLVAALADRLEHGEPDVRALPWPAPRPASSHGAAPGCDVLVVMPHPDDESIYLGGTLAALTTAGQRVRLVTVTDGGGGRGAGDLGHRREVELEAAAHVLGLASVRILGWDDFGKYRDEARNEPVTAGDALRVWGLRRSLERLVLEIRRERPRRLLGLDPEVDPNLSLHGHHLGLGLLLAVAFHAAADPDFAPGDDAAWACDEHRVAAPPMHAAWSDAFEIDRATKRSALRAHMSQRYSTARLLRALDDPQRPAIEHTRRLQARRPCAWTLVRGSAGPALDAGIDWAAEVERVTVRPRPRAALVELLRRQAGDELSPQLEDSLLRLSRPRSVAVVTGQQVGLLGGPAYTLAKALTAVALARRLQHRRIDAVPVFWLASQDHDLDEAQRVPRLDDEPLDLGLVPDGRPVGARRLGPGIDALWSSLTRSWASVVDDELLQRMRRACTAKATFTESFVAILREATRDTGLLVLDPSERAFARLARPLLHRALHEADAVDEALARARERLSAEGTRETIATCRPLTQLFWLDDDGRRRRLAREGLDLATLDRVLDQTPERLSAAALLRPLVQDHVLPTIATVAGPTERRYLEQTTELYAWADVPRSRVLARASLHLGTSADVAALTNAGGIDALRREPRPLSRIGRAALPTEARDWLAHIEALVSALATPQVLPITRLREHLARVTEPAPAAWQTLPRLAHTWPQRRTELHARAKVLVDACDPAVPRSREAARLRASLLGLRRSLLRDGRRRAPEAVAAWRRVGSDPCAPERRCTVAELLVRGGPSLPAAIVSALGTDAPPELMLTTGDLA